MSETRIDDCLSNRDGVLFIEGMASQDLIERFGSPLFVFSEDQLRRNVRRFQKAFQDGWPDGPVKVMPAAKANWVTAVQRILAELEREGWDGVMVLEASMACRKTEASQARLHVKTTPRVAPTILEGDFRLNAGDARMLAALGISPSRYRTRPSRIRRRDPRDADR